MDFNNEAANSERVRRDMEASGLDVVVPRIHQQYTTERVIVMEFCPGFKVTDSEQLDAHGVDREALLRRICQAFAYQVYVNGFFNCDPHPGNILVQVENGHARPVLLDYGMCRELTDEKRLAFAQMIYSASVMDFGSLLGSFEKMGLKLKRMDPAEDMKNIRFVLRDTAPGTEMRKVRNICYTVGGTDTTGHDGDGLVGNQGNGHCGSHARDGRTLHEGRTYNTVRTTLETDGQCGNYTRDGRTVWEPRWSWLCVKQR